MCGIGGVAFRSPSPALGSILGALAHGLTHRGPDGEGFWTSACGDRAIGRTELPKAGALGLVHRRLSIVDLITGDQPMRNEDGSLWVVFNGEIYNHQDLRASLEAKGHRFRSTSDTEVLVHGWEEWGEALFGKLNGIFAIALADERRQRVILARDPMGVKPLYVGVASGMTWWASELVAAAGAKLVQPTISPDGLKLYLMFRFIPSPESIFQQAWKVPPSHYVIVKTGEAGINPRFQRYATGVRSTAEPRGRREWSEAVVGELRDSVRRQLMSDVPVGTLLSGGLDSSLVSLFMRDGMTKPPESFGIGFAADGGRSEAAAAEAAAKVLGLPHHTTLVEDDAYLREWPDACRGIGEPLGNSSGLLLGMLCRSVHRTHKVVLSGQGADEPLGGYPRHMAERLYKLGRWAPRVSAFVAEGLLGRGAGGRLRRVLATGNLVDRYLAVFTVLPPEAVDQLVVGGAPARELGRSAIERWLPDEPSGDSLNDLLRVDARTSLVDDLLYVADHFSMRSSVELRVPFLDLQFLDLVERMPSRYKISAFGERKWLYRREACSHLPAQLRHRVCGVRAGLGRKMGFHTPLERWFAADASPLGEPRQWIQPLARHNLIRGERLNSLVEGARLRAGENVRELLALFSLSQWVEMLST